MVEKKEEKPVKTGDKVERDELGRVLPGSRLNPNGRPEGSLSIKNWIKKYLENNPGEFKKLCKYYLKEPKMRDLLWKMIDGLPKQSLKLEADEMISKVTFELVTKHEGNKTTNNESVPEKLGGVPKKEIQDSDK